MSAITVRKSIDKLLDGVKNEDLLNKYRRILEIMIKGDKRSIVGFEPDGKPIKLEELIRDLELAEEDIRSGRVHSQEEVERYFTSKFEHI